MTEPIPPRPPIVEQGQDENRSSSPPISPTDQRIKSILKSSNFVPNSSLEAMNKKRIGFAKEHSVRLVTQGTEGKEQIIDQTVEEGVGSIAQRAVEIARSTSPLAKDIPTPSKRDGNWPTSFSNTRTKIDIQEQFIPQFPEVEFLYKMGDFKELHNPNTPPQRLLYILTKLRKNYSTLNIKFEKVASPPISVLKNYEKFISQAVRALESRNKEILTSYQDKLEAYSKINIVNIGIEGWKSCIKDLNLDVTILSKMTHISPSDAAIQKRINKLIDAYHQKISDFEDLINDFEYKITASQINNENKKMEDLEKAILSTPPEDSGSFTIPIDDSEERIEELHETLKKFKETALEKPIKDLIERHLDCIEEMVSKQLQHLKIFLKDEVIPLLQECLNGLEIEESELREIVHDSIQNFDEISERIENYGYLFDEETIHSLEDSVTTGKHLIDQIQKRLGD